MGPFTAEELESRWQRPSADPLANTFNIDATSLASFVKLKAHFSAPVFAADALISVDVCVVVSSPSPIEFSQLRVAFSESAYDDSCVLDGATTEPDAESPLLFEPGVVKAFRFRFFPRLDDVGNSLRITSVSLYLGDAAQRCAILTWNEGGGDVMSSTSVSSANPPSSASADETLAGPNSPFWQRPPPKRQLAPEEEWLFIPRGVTTAKLESRPPHVAVHAVHAPPCLVNEFYVVRVSVVNEEDVMITDVSLSVDLLNVGLGVEGPTQPPQPTIEESTHLFLELPENTETPPTLPRRIAEIPLPDLEAGQSCEKTFYVKATQSGERRFAILVNYAIDVSEKRPEGAPGPLHASSRVVPTVVDANGEAAQRRCLCLASTEFSMQSIRPFQIVTKPLTAKFEATEVVFEGEPFLLTCDIKCISGWPIHIKTSYLDTSEHIQTTDGESKCFILFLTRVVMHAVSFLQYYLWVCYR